MAPVASTVAKSAKPNAKKKSTNVRTDVLLDVIKQYPVLYDKRHPQFKDIKYKDEVWTMLGESLGGIPGVDLVNKFKNAKDTYQKHNNKIICSMKSRAGAAQVGKITWPHFMQMMEIMEPVSPNPILHTNLQFDEEERLVTQMF
ncbi:uncharacterized protein LOC120846533 [Ixodes scapularis]|uniref:uncharacterized protein LOC120846533 n=1 Tax=Ixodes scapularis TaxID=6945 RepID=UPI001A9D3A4B|nr:uncharacterized protein LOC120846533 [Ixodes scapularis]